MQEEETTQDEETKTTDGQEQTSETQENAEPQELTYDGWLDTQDEDVKQLVTSHISGLKSALDSERDQRKKLAKQVSDLSKLSEGNEQAQAQIAQISDQLNAMNRQTSFYEVAHGAGVADLRAAYLIAQDRNLINDKGDVDIDGLKAVAPYLFSRKTTIAPSNAGNGTLAKPTRPLGMNDAIRQAAGRS